MEGAIFYLAEPESGNSYTICRPKSITMWAAWAHSTARHPSPDNKLSLKEISKLPHQQGTWTLINSK